jgi:hypothetical protein
MAVAASGRGRLLVRVDPARSAALQAETGAVPMEMRGKAMAGWLRVESAVVDDDGELAAWVGRASPSPARSRRAALA